MQRRGAASGTEPAVGTGLNRREFLRLGGVGLAGMALLGMASPVLGETFTPAPKLGISPSNSPSENRKNLVKALTNSGRSVTFPPGDYQIDNSGSYIVIRNFSGTLRMESGARFVFANSTKRGLIFNGGADARLYGVTATFKTLPGRRFDAQACLAFVETTGTVVKDANIRGSAGGGLFFGECVRPSVYDARIVATMADGLHFANCRNARADSVHTEDTGDDGLAFLNYSSSLDYSGGLATNITIKNSGTRGITVIGQRDVTIRNFSVDTTFSCGILVAHEAYWNTRVPDDVHFVHGEIVDAGKGESGNGSGTPSRCGIGYGHVRSAAFTDVKVVSPATRGVSGAAPNGVIRLNNVRVSRAPEAGFNLSAARLYLYGLLSTNSGKTGFWITDSELVRYERLRSINSSKKDDLKRAFNFERNDRMEGKGLIVVDRQKRATGYKVNASGKQSGRLGTIYGKVTNAKVEVHNASRLSYKGPVRI